MNSKIKIIIISAVVVLALILAYIFLIKKSPEQANLTSSSSGDTTTTPNMNTPNKIVPVDTTFLNNLLGIKDIQLNTSILHDATFMSLRNSTVILTPDGNEGRKNPFAPIGSDTATVINSNLPVQNDTTGNNTENNTTVLNTLKKN